MGRKIPGRKHHGVKDPEKQRIEREKLLKNRINAPPINPDEQQIPKSLTRLMELKERVKNGRILKKKINKVKVKDTSVPKFIQGPGESDNKFLYRVNRICNNIQKEAAYEKKYGVEIRRDEFGEVEKVVKRPKDPVELMMKEVKKKKKKKKGKKENEQMPKLTKQQKRQLKIKAKKMKNKNEDEIKDFTNYKDNIQFGEQVHAPPSLTTLPKKAQQTETPKPGRKQLLLKSLLNNEIVKGKENAKNKSEENLKKSDSFDINRKGKRKDLPNALRRQLEKQQEEIIQAYKKIKLKRYGK